MFSRFLLRLEGALVGFAALLGYHLLGASWGLFLLLLLVPDVFMIGYLTGARRGAVLYNLGHTYTGPLIIGGVAFALSNTLVGAIALVWTTHIGLDRALGYGLKSPTGFHNTHLTPTAPQRSSPSDVPVSPAGGSLSQDVDPKVPVLRE